MSFALLQRNRDCTAWKGALALFCAVVSFSCSESKSGEGREDQKRQSENLIEGLWVSGSTRFEFRSDELRVFVKEEEIEYPSGAYHILDGEFGMLKLDDGTTEKFLYELEAEELTLTFQRSGPITLSKK